MSNSYQNFGQGGASDSAAKLKALQLPPRMDGMRVLDMGCNAGYFCIECARRGASVVGVELRADYRQDAIERAEKAGVAERCEFLPGNWREVLPGLGGKFDLVLWLAAMHYEPRPALVAGQIARVLAPGGKLILEVGVADDRGNPGDWAKLPRPGVMDSYPTRSMLGRIFAGYVLRFVSPSGALPHQGYRAIFHATRQLPVVLLLGGVEGSGKTTLAGMLSAGAVWISIDALLAALDREPPPDSEFGAALQKFRREVGPPMCHQDKLLDFDADGWLVRQLAALVCHHITPDFPLYVVEGGLLTYPAFRAAMVEELGEGMVVWSAGRMESGARLEEVYPQISQINADGGIEN